MSVVINDALRRCNTTSSHSMEEKAGATVVSVGLAGNCVESVGDQSSPRFNEMN